MMLRAYQQRGQRCILLLLLLTSLFSCAPEDTQTVEIFRDHFGTPHIFATSNYGVYYGYGYTVASDRLYQMEILKRTVTGQVAEVLGSEFVTLDTHIRTRYDLPSIKRQTAALAAGDYEILQAYADGMNRRIDELLANPEHLLPAEFTHNDFLPEPWRAEDVAMIFIGAVAHRYSDFNSELDNLKLLQALIASKGEVRGWAAFRASKWLLDKTSVTTVQKTRTFTEVDDRPPPPAMPKYLHTLPVAPGTARVALDALGQYAGITSDPKVRRSFNQELAINGFESSPEFAPSSNLWAVNKGLAKARGIMVNGPQFGFSLPSYVYGIGLHGGDFAVVGNTLLALPALLFAHNRYLSWGSTAGLSDQVDVYVETLNPDNPEQYLHRGQYRDFEFWTEVIAIKAAVPVTVKARRSAHGMVTSHHPKIGVAYARARAWEGRELATLFAWVNLAKDQNLNAFRTRLAKIATNINLYCMDAQGNLSYIHTGLYPVRAEGHDSRLPAPGTGEFDWLGFRSYSDNPHALNPASGYLANWNNRPSHDWISSDTWSFTWGRADRAKLLFDQLGQLAHGTLDAVWSINQAVALQDVSAPFLLPYLKQALQRARLNKVEAEAAQSLLQWDQRWQPDAQHQYGAGATLMETWLAELLRVVFKDDVGEKFYWLYAPTNTPVHALGASMHTGPGTKALIRNLDDLSQGQAPDYDFFNGQDYHSVLSSSFQAAVSQLLDSQGAKVSAWRLPAHPMQWQPYNFRGVPQADKATLISHPFYMNRGSENNIFIAENNGNLTGYDVIPPGQSGFVDPRGVPSAHTANQMSMFTSYQYKPMPFSRQEVEAQAVEKKVLRIKIRQEAD